MPSIYCGDCSGDDCPGTNNCRRYKTTYNTAWNEANPARRWAQSSIRDHVRTGYIVELTIDELTDMYICTPRCRYCGRNMSTGPGCAHPLSPTLDRTDNSDVITMYNSQIICHNCNSTKSSRTHDEFVLYMEEVLQRLREEKA